jgi:diguanylate cyclase (GGDEF)-like protein/PAS domain S-box-containing protein
MIPKSASTPNTADARAHEVSTDAKSAGTEAAVSLLIETLGETDRCLEELTGGQVDTVTDREGRSFLLQRAQERWRQSLFDQQAAIIDALPAQIALINVEGTILSANDAWRRFADGHGLRDADYAIGRNYLEVCDGASGEGAAEAAQAAAGIRAVLAGSAKSFSLEYPCHTATEERWSLLTVAPVDRHFPLAAIVMHFDITARKRGEADRHRLAAAMDASHDAIFVIDRADMRTIHVNEAAARMYEMDRDRVLALKPWEILSISRAELEEIYDALIRGEPAEPTELLLSLGNAAPRWIETRRHARCIGGRWTIVATDRDVTARKEAESRIVYLNRVYAVLSGINTLIVRARDRDELYRSACRITVEQGSLAMSWIGVLDKSSGRLTMAASEGMDEEFIAGVTRLAQAHSMADPGDSVIYRNLVEKRAFVSNDVQSDKSVNFGEMLTRRGINSIAALPLVVAEQPVGVMAFYAREPGFFHAEQQRLLEELAGDVAFAMTHIEKQERLDYLAYYDVLTGLANRNLYLERLAQCMRGAVASGCKLAVYLLDLERFKNINDSLGRVAGDSLLVQVAQWLTSEVGDANYVARIDADRFAVVMPTVEDEDEVARRLGHVLHGLNDHSFTLNDTAFRIAAKAGVAIYPDDGTDADTLVKHAEVALKKAKVAGDRYLFYALKMTETVVGRLNMENQLRRALELDEFVLHYQPKVEAASGKLIGAEALIRWNDPRSGLVPPARFIPILEETGLIHDVGRWALDKAVADYLRWRDAGLPAVRIAVNLSALQLRNRGFIANMQRVIGVDARAEAGLELEITESLIMQDVKLSILNLQAIRAMGVRIAIDDFGTGFSSLSYLSKLPVDSVKIDRSFIAEMVEGPQGLSLVTIIINLAHSLKLKVVAEGVETEEQSRLLQLLNCDELQGFLISRPLPAAAFEENFLRINKGPTPVATV